MSEPILSLETLTRKLEHMDDTLMRYQTSVNGKKAVTEVLAKSLENGSAHKMKAVNPICRIQFAAAALSRLHSCFLENNVSRFFFVTIISDQHAMRCRDAGSYKVIDHRKWISEILAGFDFVGMIEVAYYPKAPFRAGGEEPWVSWHVHAIVWNTTKAKIEKLQQRINRDYQSFNPDRSAFHHHLLTAEELESRVAYICKLPNTEYNAYMTLAPGAIDPVTGIRRKVPTGRVRQNKGKLMPGATVKALIALGPRRGLLLLCVAGGQGSQLLSEVLDNTRAQLKAMQAQHDQEIRAIYDPSVGLIPPCRRR